LKSFKEKNLDLKFNRIDEAIFNSLTQEDINKIIYVELARLEERNEMNYKFEISESAINFLAKEYDAYGARPLGRAIQTYI
jgi:ATP-dependent Clp protease ATP-binding subunit ClpA